jgi:hypothetical protein
MGTDATTAKTTSVTLVRLGDGSKTEEYTLPEGSTLADLLRQAQVRTTDQLVWIDGKPLEEFVILPPGTTVTLVPKPEPVPFNDRWRETFGMFKDDPTFQEMVEAGRAFREADREAARKEAGDEA